MGVMSWLSGRVYGDRYLGGSNDTSALHAEHQYPDTHDGWVRRYDWLWGGYVGEPYTVSNMKSLGLFRALDDAEKVIAETRRLTRDVAHVVDTDARAMANGISLANAVESAMANRHEEAMRAVWKRSNTRTNAGAWARSCAGMGAVGLEAVRMERRKPYGSKIVPHDPRTYRCEYDETGTVLERVIFETAHFDPAEIRNGRLYVPGVMSTYLKVIDAQSVRVWRDGVLSEEESGEHGAGVVPFVHIPFIPIQADPGHGLWAAQGLDMALAFMDSLLTQVQAVGNRHGNPHLVGVGVRFGAAGDELKFGRAMSGIPAGGDVKYLEANLQGVGVLLDAAREARQQTRATLPEFLFSEAGASASGAALNFWAAAFVAKMDEARWRWFDLLVRVTEIAEAMDRDAAYEETGLVEIAAPPILPVNAPEEFKVVTEARANGGIKRVDYVKHLQRLGIVPREVDPAQYAEEARQEQAEDDQRLADAINGAAPQVDVAPQTIIPS